MLKFSGINNVADADRLFPLSTDYREKEFIFPLSEANNVEIDNTNKIKSRSGYSRVIQGGAIHSLWSDGELCFFADETSLYQMQNDYSTALIFTDAAPYWDRLSYVRVNDRVYFTNGITCGYVKDFTRYNYATPTGQFMRTLPCGQLIEYFMGCLFVARDNMLYISEPLTDYYDTRIGYRQFADNITMLRACDNGLYISDKKVWFIKGKGNEQFERIEVESDAAIPFTDVRTSAESISYGTTGDVVMWTSEKGVCLGDSSGTVKNLTHNVYVLGDYGRGAAFIRDVNNVKHYINSFY